MKLFIDYYVEQGFKNAAEAARRAGYAKKTARTKASQLLTRIDVKKEIGIRISEFLTDTDKATLELIQSLDEIIQSDIGEFANIETVTGKHNPITGKCDLDFQKVIFNNTADLNTRLLSEISENKDGAIKIKMQDRLKAIELKGKYLSLWSDGFQLVGKETKKEALTKKERRERILQLTKKMDK